MNTQLLGFLQTGNIPHALLFSGPKNSEKKEAAYQFVSQLLHSKKQLENHPDAHHFFPEGKLGLHPIESIRKLAHHAALEPFEAAWKVFIIHNAEKMLPTSSNALLKTLEEPPAQTVIILLSDHVQKMLPTITSRCQKIDFAPGQAKKIDEKLLDFLVNDNLSDFETEDPDALFETILFWYRDRLLLELGNEELLHFPHLAPQLQKAPLLPLEEVQKKVGQAKLAYERSTKLSTCLEMLCLNLKQIKPFSSEA